MRKALLITIALGIASSAVAWNNYGHQIVVKIATRNITDRAQANIRKFFDYPLEKEASWMDRHCNDPEILCTKSWHTFVADPRTHLYDPGYRLAPGDAIRALNIADWNLRHWRELTDSAVQMNIRMLVHFVGDMHCPSHCYFGPKTHYKVNIQGKDYKSFHALYDMIATIVHKERKGETMDQVAEQLSGLKKSQARKIQAGNLYDWAKDCADYIAVIFEWNPYGSYKLLDDTIERSTPMCDRQLQYGGYRLAKLLNEYFDN